MVILGHLSPCLKLAFRHFAELIYWVEAAPREAQSQNLMQSKECADNPLGEPRGCGTVGSLTPRTEGSWPNTHLLCSVLTTEAARAATCPQIRKLCKVPIVLSKAGLTGAGDVLLWALKGKIPQAKVVLSI